MNRHFTEWSLPWHELQRSLADGFAPVPGAHAAIGWLTDTGGDVRRVPASAHSWLVRARTRVPPVGPANSAK